MMDSAPMDIEIVPLAETSSAQAWTANNNMATYKGEVLNEELKHLKSLLNKLTVDKFPIMKKELCPLLIKLCKESAERGAQVVDLLMNMFQRQRHFLSMWARLCHEVIRDSKESDKNAAGQNFRYILLAKCEDEFHRCAGLRSQAGSDTDFVARKNGLIGTIKFLGELFLMPGELVVFPIIDACVSYFLEQCEDDISQEDIVEAMCNLISTIGSSYEKRNKNQANFTACFKQIRVFTKHQEIKPRLKFLLLDLIELKKNKWRKRKAQQVEQARTLEEIRRDHRRETTTVTHNSNNRDRGRR
jgi:translation initiation factor 4G